MATEEVDDPAAVTVIVEGTIEVVGLGDLEKGATQKKILIKTIKNLFVSFPEIEACAVVSTDGITKAAVLGEGMDESRFGAMCASILGLAKTAAIETRRGDLRLVLIQGTDGVMLVVQIGAKGVLAVAAGPKASLGRVFHEARRTAEEVAAVL